MLSLAQFAVAQAAEKWTFGGGQHVASFAAAQAAEKRR